MGNYNLLLIIDTKHLTHLNNAQLGAYNCVQLAAYKGVLGPTKPTKDFFTFFSILLIQKSLTLNSFVPCLN